MVRPLASRVALAAAMLALGVLASGLPAAASAQQVRVAPGRTSLPLGETVTVQIVLSGRFDETRGPDLADFDVVGKSSGTSVSVVNGQMTQEHQVTLQLLPKRAGTLTIGSIELVSAGKVVASSRPVQIRVSGKGAPPTAPAPPPGAPPESAPEGAPPDAAPEPSAPAPQSLARFAGKRWFLVPRVPERPLYAGEPIYVEYVLYSAADLSVADARLETPPALKGFVVTQPRDPDTELRRVRIGEVPYDGRVVWRGAVTPLEAGRVVLPPASAAIYVGDGFFVQTRRVASDAVTLDILPLPDSGRPADFVEGTVGQFVVRASLDKSSVRVGEAALLTVDVTGSGNLSSLRAPPVPPPPGMRVARVPASDLDETVVDRGGVSGRRAFQYLLTPEREGRFEIGRIELPHFNPVAGRYERSRTEAIRVVATGGAGGPIHEVRKERIVPVIASSDLAPAPGRVPDRSVGREVVMAGVGVPMALFLVAEAVARRRAWRERNGTSHARRRALADAEKRLKSLARSAPAGEGFWSGLDGVIRDFVSTRFGVPVAALTSDDLRAALAAAGAEAEVADALLAELEHCAFGRFAPSAAMERDRSASVDRVRRCLAGLDRARGGDA
ncbi:MAG: protein BatD [Deltaproteobacteria bacterium]|nr:protein BatD [Deltaproteobacteria bacterium]